MPCHNFRILVPPDFPHSRSPALPDWRFGRRFPGRISLSKSHAKSSSQIVWCNHFMGRNPPYMDLNAPLLSVSAGLICGILSGFGIGGGSLLMVWMTAAAALDQKIAQGINLLYFIPTSICALIFHIKNKLICKKAVLPAALCGCIAATLSAWFSASIDVGLLRKLFGGFLILVGFREIFRKIKTK